MLTSLLSVHQEQEEGDHRVLSRTEGSAFLYGVHPRNPKQQESIWASMGVRGPQQVLGEAHNPWEAQASTPDLSCQRVPRRLWASFGGKESFPGPEELEAGEGQNFLEVGVLALHSKLVYWH